MLGFVFQKEGHGVGCLKGQGYRQGYLEGQTCGHECEQARVAQKAVVWLLESQEAAGGMSTSGGSLGDMSLSDGSLGGVGSSGGSHRSFPGGSLRAWAPEVAILLNF